MRKKFLILTLLPLALIFLCACNVQEMSSLKAITKPYITQYECIEAKLGNENFLEGFDYIRLTLLNKSDLELTFKRTNGKKRTATGTYTFDEKTHEFSADVGVLGIKYTQKTVIENGQFVINRTLGSKQLTMKFKAM